jgi:hypothetical protein
MDRLDILLSLRKVVNYVCVVVKPFTNRVPPLTLIVDYYVLAGTECGKI